MRSKKPELAVAKHRKLLKGTGFANCADCNGTTGKFNGDGNMLCANVNGIPIPVTVVQAKKCDGTKPPPHNKQKEKQSNKIHPIFRKLEHHRL